MEKRIKHCNKILISSGFINTFKNQFYEKVLLPNEHGCMIHTGARAANGYVRIWNNKKRIFVHRLSYNIFKGEIPKNMLVCHTCDVTNCVAPEHLWLGTFQDNNKDRVLKNRSARLIGEKNSQAKLSNIQVFEIRKLLEKNELSQREIARRYNIHYNAIWKIKNKLKWENVYE